ncbi:hypothetical protein [Blastomonas sp. AAP53]|uniref:hypothetical protein n=1 Tax=Blastomonas sp. AAP53 TaxID=1248760 RepID=UPI0012677E2D|nr:hypothetical protein [Blastomonas sp. AAP53]
MSNPASRFPVPSCNPPKAGDSHKGAISAADEQAFVAASERLTAALEQAGSGRTHEDIAIARQRLRELAVKLRDAGYWRSDKKGLRATVSLLWQADRYVSDIALRPGDRD